MPSNVTPTDPQGAEGRETRTEWRNVYREASGIRPSHFTHISRAQADESARYATAPRVAIEEITTTITRHPLGGTERE